MIRSVLLSMTLFYPALTMQAQTPAAAITAPLEVTLAYSTAHINAPPGGCGCFWMTGGKVEANAILHPGLSIVAELAGQHASNINSRHEDLSLVSYLFGPRYSYHSNTKLVPFAEALLGGVHGFDAFFPNQNGSAITPDALAVAAGGGLNISLSPHLAVRIVQVDYFLTRLPNNAGNHENNLRLSAGIVFRFPGE